MEEPVIDDVATATVDMEPVGDVIRVRLVMPASSSPEVRNDAFPLDRGFEDRAATGYGDLLATVLSAASATRPDVWLCTPMALDIAQRLDAGLVVYDVMDDLASFKGAPPGLVLRQRRLLAEADVVFTGGPSLHRSIRRRRTDDVHLFRSGVESAHYAQSRRLRTQRERKVAGYVGVLDERLDLVLLRELAEQLPNWAIRIVGPVATIDAADLPKAANLEYPGMASYDELPAVMAGLDVALMPFALNEATRSISPTKTLEYLAAGLPVVSTRVPDVVADYADVVHLADDGAAFAAACRKVERDDCAARDRRAHPLQSRQEWDTIASSMSALLEAARTDAGLLEETA